MNNRNKKMDSSENKSHHRSEWWFFKNGQLLDLYQKGEYGEGGYYPDIVGLVSDNFFGIRGDSYMSFALEHFQPTFDWLRYYLETKPQKFRVEFWLEYFHTSTLRILLEMLLMFEKYQLENENVIITANWYFEPNDYDMKDEGKILKSELESLELNLIPYDRNADYYKNMQKIFNIES